MRVKASGSPGWTLPELLANGDTSAYEPEWHDEEPAPAPALAASGGAWAGELISPFALSEPVAPQAESRREEPSADTREAAEPYFPALPAPEVFSVQGELEDWADTLLRLPAQVRSAIQRGMVPVAVQLLIAAGNRDENWLTDLVFHVRHPELHGRAIRPGEHDLAEQWMTIRTGFVRPLLLAARAPHPSGPVAAPVTTASPRQARPVADWRQRALRSAGIDPAAWKPDDGFETLRPIVERVYAYYLGLFNRNENLLWAGMAKLAGGEVLSGLLMAQRYLDTAAAMNATGADPAVTAFPDIAAGYARVLQFRLLEGQKAIFWDLGWQHQAFVEAGLPELEAAAGTDVAIGAWRDIASGDAARVRQGNRALLRREQEVVLAPLYAAIRAIWDFDQIPAQMSGAARSPVPGGKPFRDVVPGGDITVFADRWKWLVTDMLPAYEGLTAERRRQLVNTPLAALAEHRWPPG